MKNFDILGVRWKIWLLEGRVRKKPIDRGGLLKKGGVGQFADLRGAWLERGGGVFEGSWYSDAHYDLFKKTYLIIHLSLFGDSW